MAFDLHAYMAKYCIVQIHTVLDCCRLLFNALQAIWKALYGKQLQNTKRPILCVYRFKNQLISISKIQTLTQAHTQQTKLKPLPNLSMFYIFNGGTKCNTLKTIYKRSQWHKQTWETNKLAQPIGIHILI